MDHEEAAKIIKEAEAMAAAGDYDGASAHVKKAMAGAAAEGMTIPATQLQAVADLVQRSVEHALQELIDTARALGADSVPVVFIEEVQKLPAAGVKGLWMAVDRLEAPVDWGVPDDLSELEQS